MLRTSLRAAAAAACEPNRSLNSCSLCSALTALQRSSFDQYLPTHHIQQAGPASQSLQQV